MSRKSRKKKRRQHSSSNSNSNVASTATPNRESNDDVRSVEEIENTLEAATEAYLDTLDPEAEKQFLSAETEGVEPTESEPTAEQICEEEQRNETIVTAVESVGGVLDQFIQQYNELAVLVADGVAISAGCGNAKLGIQHQLEELTAQLAQAEQGRAESLQLLEAANSELEQARSQQADSSGLQERLEAANRRNETLTQSLAEALAEAEKATAAENDSLRLETALEQEKQRCQTLTEELSIAANALTEASELQSRLEETQLQLADSQQQYESLEKEILEQPAATEGPAPDAEHAAVLQQRIEELEQQLAERASLQSASSASSDSWEAKREQMLQQMDSGEFDADTFVEELSASTNVEIVDDCSPQDFVNDLCEQLQQQQQELAEVREELSDHKEQLSEAESNENAGIDSEQLAEIKSQYERRLQQAETDASVERAKFSRERTTLNARIEELENGSGPQPGDAKAKKRSWLKR